MAITRSQPTKERAETPVTPKKISPGVLLNSVRDRPGAAISKQLRVSQGIKKRTRRPSAQLREELESAISRIASVKEHKEALRFLFVPYPDVKDIAQETHIAIDASNTSDRFLARYPMYNAENMSMIQQELGKGFASHGMTSTKPYYEIPILHQGVVTMQHLSLSFKRDVTFRSWEWLQSQLKMVAARPKHSPTAKTRHPPPRKTPTHPRKAQQHALFTNRITPCIIFLHWTIDPGPSTFELNFIYATIATLQSSRPNHLFRAFPSHSEITSEQSKIPDIRALDAIASTSPPQYAYRPQTCTTHTSPTHDLTRCPLHKHPQIIMKRTHSCSGEHVELIPGDSALPRHQPPLNPSSPTQHTWFAQSYEPLFSLIGEFRIFILACPSPHDPRALRNRRGRILHTVITEWVSGYEHPGLMYARVATSQDFHHPDLHPLQLSDLHEFALYVYERLRGRGDWEERFESLEVGVRLDVGVGVEVGRERVKGEGKGGGGGKEEGKGKGGERRFFVNEITRFYGADYFSQHTLGAPQQEVCWGFAEAVDGYFGAGKGVVKGGSE